EFLDAYIAAAAIEEADTPLFQTLDKAHKLTGDAITRRDMLLFELAMLRVLRPGKAPSSAVPTHTAVCSVCCFDCSFSRSTTCSAFRLRSARADLNCRAAYIDDPPRTRRPADEHSGSGDRRGRPRKRKPLRVMSLIAK